MNPYRSVVTLSLSLVAAGAALAAVQQRPVFRAGVETVQVDVVVHDRTGKPVQGLTADDFVILDRGKPQSVVTFRAVDLAQSGTPSFASHFPITTRLDVSSNQATEARRLVVLVLDDLHGYRGRDEVVKKIARDVVQKLGSDTLVALLMTSGNYNVEITEDRGRVVAGIDRFKGARAVRRPMQAIDERRGSGAGVQPPGRGGAAVTRDSGVDLGEFDANLRLYGTLEQAARLFSGADGRRKAFVLISENLAKNLSGVLQAQRVAPDEVSGGEEYAGGNLEGLRSRSPMYHDMAVLDAIQSLRKSNVATYAIDPRGEITAEELLEECHPGFGFRSDPCTGGESSSGPPSFTSWVRIAQNGLQQFAAASGGFAVINSDDFAGGVASIIDDLDNYYLLGFNTDDSKTQGFRRLEVQVKNRRDLQLRYRRGYQIDAKGAAAPEAKDALFGLAAGALPNAGVPLRMMAAALPGSGSDARIPVTIEATMPRLSLEEPDQRLRDQIQYSVAVVDMRGAKVKEATGYGAQLVLRPRENAGPPPDTVTYQIGLVLSLPPGRYQLRALLLSTKLKEGGSVYLPLDVPDFPRERIAVSAIVVGYSRVPFAEGSPAGALANRIAGTPPPAPGPTTPGLSGLPFVPTLDREFLVTNSLDFYFEVAHKDRARAVAVDLRVVDRNDDVAQQYGQTLAVKSAGKVTVRLPLKNIGAGAFRVRVHASDGVNDAFSEVAIVVR